MRAALLRAMVLLLGLALLLCLMSAYPGEAAPKQKAAPVAPTPPLEAWCGYFGELASAIAVDRDTMTPLTVTFQRLRTILATSLRQFPPQERANLATRLTDLAAIIYRREDLSPARARYTFEVGCLYPGEETLTGSMPAGIAR